MNLVHINSDYGNTIYKFLSDELSKLGVKQRVFKFVRPNNYPREKYDDYVDVRLNHNNIDRYIFHLKHKKAINDFLSFYKGYEIDIIHAHTLFSNGYIAYKVHEKLKIPYVVTVRSTDIEVFFKNMIHLRRLGIRILKDAKRITFLSHSHKELVLNKYVPKKIKQEIENKIFVIPNGIDDFYFSEIGKPKKLNRNKELIIMTAAWINKNKNQENVSEAINILKNNGYNIKYRIIGGVEKKDLKTSNSLIEKLQSYSFVQLIPRKSKQELIDEYRRADLFAMVSYRETFGLSYIEALLQGVPIIYTKNQGIDGYFEEGEVGYASNPYSPEDIAEKIELTIKNYERLSINSLKVVDNFKWNKVAESYFNIYK